MYIDLSSTVLSNKFPGHFLRYRKGTSVIVKYAMQQNPIQNYPKMFKFDGTILFPVIDDILYNEYTLLNSLKRKTNHCLKI